MPDDPQLINALKERDPTALSELFETYADKLYRLALNLLHNEQSADGVVQDTFIKLIKHIDNFEGRSSISTWLYRVAYNECMMRLRQQRPQVDLDAIDTENFMPANMSAWADLPDAAMLENEALAEMCRAVERLSPALRAVFTLRDIEELSIRETADILQISTSAVKVRLHRARLQLREHLAIYFDDHTNTTQATQGAS